MKPGDAHEAIIIDRPVGSIVNLGVGEQILAFRLTRKMGTVAMFPGGHGKSTYQMTCIKTRPMSKIEIARAEGA